MLCSCDQLVQILHLLSEWYRLYLAVVVFFYICQLYSLFTNVHKHMGAHYDLCCVVVVVVLVVVVVFIYFHFKE